ncbi:hypothetical protein BDA99DRAFT_558644 [Phascolomyces articulosus]|uniref:Zinc finger PHD-type domain-containing protein n=1 Tax=Phascolomyces articulosus TaxID=60185 RepID=A0AAD5K2L2_9FUNG|nr:hypothetical protein BDA99DRAFT_558644 [Phascolomyces articulosus]
MVHIAPSRRSGRTQTANARKPTTRSGTMTQRHDTLPSSPRQTRTDKIVQEEEEEEDEEEEEEDDEEEEEDDEESSDSASVTRCLCGEQHNLGLMVQCDKCEVWQHCDCVGLTERDLPDLYYCDHCQPNNHVLYKTNGRMKRAYNPHGCDKNEDNQLVNNNGTPEKQDEPEARATKRRKREINGTRKTTSNNHYQHNNKPISSRRQPTTATPMATRTQKNGVVEKHEEECTDSNTMHDQNNSHPTSPDQKSEEQFQQHHPSPPPSQPLASSSSQQHVTPPKRTRRKSGDDNNQVASPLSEEPLPSPPVSRGRKQAKSGGRRNIHQHGSPQRQTNGRHKESPRATTPLVSSDDASGNNNNGNGASNGATSASTPTPQLYWDEEGLPARESSPPAKVKYPSPRMSIADMNKRAKQIMDYVNKMHVDLVKKRPEPHPSTTSSPQQEQQQQPKPDHIKRQRTRSDSTSSSSSSLSSASTLPLLEDDEHHPNNQQQKYPSSLGSITSPTTPIPVVTVQQPETTLDMMNRITHDLIQFQKKFGSSIVASSNAAMVSSPRAKKLCRH